MDIYQITLFLLLALIAEFLGTIGGFGSSVFFIPLASLFLDFQSVLGITAIFHVVSNINKIFLFKQGFDKFLLIYLGIPAILFVILGAYLSKIIPLDNLEIILSIVLIIISLIFLINPQISFKPNKSNAIIGGGVSGIIAGLVGTGGAIRGVTLSSFNLPSTIFISTSALIDLGIDLSRSFIYTSNGYVHKHDFQIILYLFVISLIGTYFGKLVLKKTPKDKFRKIVMLLILITGVYTLIYKLI